MIDRRQFLKGSLATCIGTGSLLGMPNMGFAQAPPEGFNGIMGAPHICLPKQNALFIYSKVAAHLSLKLLTTNLP